MLSLFGSHSKNFKRLPRVVKTAVVVLPSITGSLLFSTPPYPSKCSSWPLFTTLFEGSLWNILIDEISFVDEALIAANKRRETAILQREKEEHCALSIPEPDAISILSQGINQAQRVNIVQKREYRATYEENTVLKELESMMLAKKYLESLSGLAERPIIKALKKTPNLVTVCVQQPEVVAKRFNRLKDEDFEPEEIFKFAKLLTAESDLLEKRLSMITKQFNDFSTMRMTAGILGIDTSLLPRYLMKWKREADIHRIKSRVHWLSEELEVTKQDVMDQMDSKPFLISFGFGVLKGKVLLLKDFGLNPSDICADPWVLGHTELNLTERINILKKSGVQKIKPWQLRCSVKNLRRFIATSSAAYQARSLYPDLREYFKEKLSTDETTIDIMLEKIPQLNQYTSFEKTDELIDFLYEQGFTSNQILSGPKILTFSIENIRERIAHIRRLGYDISDVPKYYFFSDTYHFKRLRERIQAAAMDPSLKIGKSRRSSSYA
ncbi:uncharacterized protein LOC136031263 isoform X2 [Artemia franciscana]|uniref:Uncharacterized protein n=2 Tax=Artemia franciscana TaxID=6661 RepID=A0AA88L254_ARTSF|nr:hypothetical protein QYM36_017128 [Artemia franciscana]